MDNSTSDGAQQCATVSTSVGEGLIAQAEIKGVPLTQVAELAKITNHDLMVMVYGKGTAAERPIVAGFEGNPNDRAQADWGSHPWWPVDVPLDVPNWNLYLTLATYKPVRGDGPATWEYVRRELHCLGVWGFLCDDLKTWHDLPLKPTWVIETSPSNFQAVYGLDIPMRGAELHGAQAVANALAAKGLCDPGALSPTTRYMRLPVAVNGKLKPAFKCRLVYLNPAARYALGELVQGLGLELKPLKHFELPRPLELLAGDMGEVQRLVKAIDVQKMDRGRWVGFMHALRGATQADPETGLQLAIEASWHHSRDEIEETIRVFKSMVVTELRSGVDELRRIAGPRAIDPTKVFDNLDEPDQALGAFSEGAEGVVATAVENAAQRVPLKDSLIAHKPVIDTGMRYVVKGLIHQSEIGLIYGASGAAKTFIMVDFAVHVAMGIAWFNGRRIGRKVGVVIVANEDSRGVGSRMHATLRHKGIDPKDVAVFITGPAANMMADPQGVGKRIQQGAAQLKREFGVEHIVVIFDTLMATWLTADDNSPEDMGKVIGNCIALRDAGMTALVVHHSGKDKARGPRGHSSLFAAVDMAIELEYQPEEGMYCATVTKRRSGVIGEQMLFGLRPVKLGVDSDGDTVEEAVVKPVEARQGDTRAEKAARLPDGVKEVFHALVDAVARFGAPFDAEVAGVRQAVTPDQWRESYGQRMPSNSTQDQGRIRAAYMRGRKRLVEEGHVGYFNGHYWVN